MFMVFKKTVLFVLGGLIFFLVPSCSKDKISIRTPYSSKQSRTIPSKDSQPPLKVPRIVHDTHLSDAWYPHNPHELNQEIDRYFKLAQNNFYVEADSAAVKALIVPHAGHYYSGLCAAAAYQTLFNTKNLNSKDLKNKTIDRVILLAPSHREVFVGAALPHYTVYRTPLGEIPLDAQALNALKKRSYFDTNKRIHETEHSIEIQLPFLQKSIKEFKLVPLIIGHLNDLHAINQVASAIKSIITPTTLLVISSDFMHHGTGFDYDIFTKLITNQVRYVDSLAVSAIEKQSLDEFERIVDETGTTICGQNPLKILLFMLMKNMMPHVESRLTCYYTSAHMNEARKEGSPIDVARLLGNVPDADAQNTVSYVSMIFTEQNLESLMLKNQLTGYEKKALLKAARESVENKFIPDSRLPQTIDKDEKIPDHLLWPITTLALQKQAGLFVTLTNQMGHLRGCMGRIASADPLYKTVGAMAYSAAFEDNRFMSVTREELGEITFGVSILSPMRTVASFHEIKLGTHGIMLKKFDVTGKLATSAVFLPQVPLQFGWNLEKTLQELSKKAGLDAHGWKEGCELHIFEGFEFKEEYNNVV